jgi:hypothetical protein
MASCKKASELVLYNTSYLYRIHWISTVVESNSLLIDWSIHGFDKLSLLVKTYIIYSAPVIKKFYYVCDCVPICRHTCWWRVTVNSEVCSAGLCKGKRKLVLLLVLCLYYIYWQIYLRYTDNIYIVFQPLDFYNCCQLTYPLATIPLFTPMILPWKSL